MLAALVDWGRRRTGEAVTATTLLTRTAAVPAAAAQETGPADIRAAIEALPGLRILKDQPATAGFHSFVLTLHQPADHRHPEKGGLERPLTLLLGSMGRCSTPVQGMQWSSRSGTVRLTGGGV
ncbi:hypothetical protein ACGF13_03125 [Kitasatospora sp. NPDC048286]|uniref:hypothetical protein n=1 Tax=Kitasatospora sp. NPDC048286 TaxID=3364047 RepID=UPI00371D0ED6